MTFEDHYPTIATTLVLGGLAVIGAAVGVRVGFAIMLQHLDCHRVVLEATPCQAAAMQMNDVMIKLGGAGIIAMASGAFAQYQIQRVNHDTDA